MWIPWQRKWTRDKVSNKCVYVSTIQRRLGINVTFVWSYKYCFHIYKSIAISKIISFCPGSSGLMSKWLDPNTTVFLKMLQLGKRKYIENIFVDKMLKSTKYPNAFRYLTPVYNTFEILLSTSNVYGNGYHFIWIMRMWRIFDQHPVL